MATDRFGIGNTARRTISYPDPTGDMAATRVDRERRLDAEGDIDALWAVADAQHIESQRGTRPLTNEHCVAAIIAARAGNNPDAALLLVNAHTPNTETPWTPDHEPATTTDWWDSEPEKSEL